MQRMNTVEGHAASLLPKENEWQLVWNDEFDGTELDRTKWSPRLNFWGKPWKAFTDEGIEVDGDSHLRLHLLKKDGYYCSPHLQTGFMTFDNPHEESDKIWRFGTVRKPHFMHKFGYYEIRCRQPKYDGWHSAFWLQSPCIGAHPDPEACGVECDIMENYRQHRDGKIICGNIWNGYGRQYCEHGHFVFDWNETEDGWHHYGVDWSPEGYVFYADGQEVGRVGGPISNIEQFILVSTECHGYRETGNYDPLLDQAVLPDYFEIDFVRVYDRKS